jgi:hypothetical protein
VRITPRRVRIGGDVRFSVRLTSTSRRAQALVVDYAVHFLKANGEARPKVFKLKRLELRAGEAAALAGVVSFAPMTTRRHYAGSHRLELRVNGVAYPLGRFEVVS